MQHHYWVTKQALSRKFGRKEDECIVASDAQLDAKLELFRNIQMSCTLIQRIIDKYQESICYLSQETNSMGRFLKENGNEDKTRAGEVMLALGKALIFCAQQQLLLHEPLVRFYQELDTFRQRAIGDSLQNVAAMEKARTEYRAALSWMKNVSQQLDPDTTKQLEKFKKVQDQVRRGKMNFDKLALDCLQKVDLLAAARCNMLNHTLTFYHNKFSIYAGKSSKTFTSLSKNFESQRQEEYQIKTLRIHSIGNNNKKINKENSLPSENETTLIGEISSENSEDLFQKFTDERSSNSAENKDLSHVAGDAISSADWSNSTLLMQPQSQEIYDKLQQEMISDCNDILKEITLGDSKNKENAKFDWTTDDGDSFLPSALLKQSLQNATAPSKKGDKNFAAGRGNSEPLTKNHSAKSWLNLFEELDPLSNNPIDKSSKNKNSFV